MSDATTFFGTPNDTVTTLLKKQLKVLNLALLGQTPASLSVSIGSDGSVVYDPTISLGVTLSPATRIGGWTNTNHINVPHAATLHAIGDAVGNLIVFPALRISSLTGLLQSVSIEDADNVKPELDILLARNAGYFGTVLDDQAFTYGAPAATDYFLARVGVASSDYQTVAGRAQATLGGLGIVVDKAVGDTTALYAAVVVRTAVTFTSTTPLRIKFGFLLD